MAGGKTFVGIIRNREVGFAGAFEYISGVVLVVSAIARTASNGDDDDGVGGDGGGVGGKVIEGGDVSGV